MITNEKFNGNAFWVVRCDLCMRMGATISQTRANFSQEPKKDWLLEQVDHNHWSVCEDHEFDGATGEWSGPYNWLDENGQPVPR